MVALDIKSMKKHQNQILCIVNYIIIQNFYSRTFHLKNTCSLTLSLYTYFDGHIGFERNGCLRGHSSWRPSKIEIVWYSRFVGRIWWSWEESKSKDLLLPPPYIIKIKMAATGEPFLSSNGWDNIMIRFIKNYTCKPHIIEIVLFY